MTRDDYKPLTADELASMERGECPPTMRAEDCIPRLVAEVLHQKAHVEVLKATIPDWRTQEESQAEETGDSLVDCLRGIYTSPINDGAGPLNGKMTFTRRFAVGKIQHDAADEIMRLRAELHRISATGRDR
jgi:hypothetical protein